MKTLSTALRWLPFQLGLVSPFAVSVCHGRLIIAGESGIFVPLFKVRDLIPYRYSLIHDRYFRDDNDISDHDLSKLLFPSSVSELYWLERILYMWIIECIVQCITRICHRRDTEYGARRGSTRVTLKSLALL